MQITGREAAFFSSSCFSIDCPRLTLTTCSSQPGSSAEPPRHHSQQLSSNTAGHDSVRAGGAAGAITELSLHCLAPLPSSVGAPAGLGLSSERVEALSPASLLEFVFALPSQWPLWLSVAYTAEPKCSNSTGICSVRLFHFLTDTLGLFHSPHLATLPLVIIPAAQSSCSC